MIAQAMFTENYDEIHEAERMGMLIKPKPVLVSDTFGFHLHDVIQFHKTNNGNIRIYFTTGIDWTLKYENDVWNKLLKKFENE